MDILNNLKIVRDRISEAQKRGAYSAESITLIAVTKTFGSDVVKAALDAGLTDVGENRMQEAEQKFSDIGKKARWHLIGHLQTNKVKKAVGIFDLIHSIDSVKVAKEINNKAEYFGKVQKVLIQINASGEESKFGIQPEEAENLLKDIRGFSNLDINGLMTIGPFVDDEQVLRNCFITLRELKEDLNNKNLLPNPLINLSMGMTNDYEIAVEEGADILRIGTAIFGHRG